MPVHTPLWRTQEGIVTLTMVPAEPEPTAVASAAASPTSANPFAQEPLFDQIFIYTAFAMICAAALCVLVAFARAVLRFCRGGPAEEDEDAERAYPCIAHAVVVAQPPPSRDKFASPRSEFEDGCDLGECFRPLCSERELDNVLFGRRKTEDGRIVLDDPPAYAQDENRLQRLDSRTDTNSHE